MGLITYNPLDDGWDTETAFNQALDPLDLFGARSGDASADALEESNNASANAMLKANTDNIDFQKWLFDEQTALQEPWLKAGQEALGRIDATPDFSFTEQDMSNFFDPSYDFRVKEGIKALDSSASARGNLFSGSQQKDIQAYGQDMASQEYSNAFARMQSANTNQFNRDKSVYDTNLDTQKSLAGVGQSSANQVQNAGQNMGSNVSQSIKDTGDALAQQYTNSGNLFAQQQQQSQNSKASAVSAGIGIASMFSDVRLKKDINYSHIENGLNIYTWNWNCTAKELGIDSMEKGVLAQEILNTRPDAVSIDDSGYYKVDYTALGLGDYNV